MMIARRIAITAAVLALVALPMTTFTNAGRANAASPLEQLVDAMELAKGLQEQVQEAFNRLDELEGAVDAAQRAEEIQEAFKKMMDLIDARKAMDARVEELATKLKPISGGAPRPGTLGATCITAAGWCVLVGGGGYCIYQANEYRQNVNTLCEPGTDPAYCLTETEINGIDVLGHPNEFLANVFNYWFGSGLAPQQAAADAPGLAALPVVPERFASPEECLEPEASPSPSPTASPSPTEYPTETPSPSVTQVPSATESPTVVD